MDSTTDGLLYSRKRDGGLGFSELGIQTKICALQAGLQLLSTDDPCWGRSLPLPEWSASAVSLTYPPTLSDISLRKLSLKMEVHTQWSELASQGAGAVWHRGDLIGNFCLLRQTALKPGQFIEALQIRTDMYGTYVNIDRAMRMGNTRCRRCTIARETLGHILGQCLAGDRERHKWGGWTKNSWPRGQLRPESSPSSWKLSVTLRRRDSSPILS